MTLVRPEIQAGLRRWSEVLIGLAIAAFGGWALQSHDRFFQLLALLILLAGLGLALNGWRRLRFQRAGDGPGIVQIIEGQITYFGPKTGGFVAIRDMVELHLLNHARTWLLISEDGSKVAIPVSAQGSDGLFDAFATLPDLHIQNALAALEQQDPPERQAIWLHPARRDARLRLS